MMIESWAQLDTLEIVTRTTILLVGVLVARVALLRASAATRHLVQALGLAAVLVLPLAAVALPSLDLPLLPAEPAAAPVATADKYQPIDEGIPLEVVMTLDQLRASEEAETRVAQTPVLDGSAGSSRGVGALILVWLVGVVAVGGRSIYGWFRLARISASSRPLDCPRIVASVEGCHGRLGLGTWPRILIGDAVRVPMVWGFCRPTLLLPAKAREWSDERLRVVLLHELAHLRRYDGLSLLLGRLATTVHWFNPLAWFVDRSARRDCERACDDVVIEAGERPSSYARHLLAIASGIPSAPVERAAALAILGRSHFEGRVRSILHPRLRRGLRRGSAVATLASVALLLGLAGSARLVAKEPVDRADTEDCVDCGALLARNDSTAGEYKMRHKEKHKVKVRFDGDAGNADSAEAIFDHAYKLHSADQFEEAIEMFEKAIDADYRVATSTYNIACGHARLGDAPAALAALEEVLEMDFNGKYLFEDSDLDPIRNEPEFRALLERVNAENGTARMDRLEETDRLYEALVRQDSPHGGAWYKVGSNLLALRDFERAVESLERARELLGDDAANALYNLACAHSLQGQIRPALDRLEQAVLTGFDSEERFENDSDLDGVRGTTRFEEIRELNHELSLDRESEYSDRRWDAAIDRFTEFTGANPTVGRAWFNLGWALHFSHRHDEAVDAFSKAVDLGYRPATASYNVACALAMQGETNAALDWLDRAIEAGFSSDGHMANDDDLESLRGNARFEALIEELDRDDKKKHKLTQEIKEAVQAALE